MQYVCDAIMQQYIFQCFCILIKEEGGASQSKEWYGLHIVFSLRNVVPTSKCEAEAE